MHVRKLPSGHYQWVVQHGGQRRDGTTRTRPEAIVAGSQALIELGAEHPAKRSGTVEELLGAWQADMLAEWSPTYTADVVLVCSRLPPRFLEREMGTVDPSVIAGLQRTLLKEGWSPWRVRRARECLSAAFRLGVTYGWCTRNPVPDVRGVSVERSPARAPSREVVRAIVATAPAAIRLFLRLSVITGARRGELCALQWDDLDGSTLSIRRAVVYTPASGLVVREQTKTGRKGDRRLVLDPDTLQILAEHHLEQTATAEARRLPSPRFVFSHDAGVTPWRPDYIGLAYRRHRATIPEAKDVRLHDLRHFVASEMLAAGDDVVKVAHQLGHANPATTLRVYAHLMPGIGDDAARRRAGLLDG